MATFLRINAIRDGEVFHQITFRALQRLEFGESQSIIGAVEGSTVNLGES
ncbi:unnamed protein product [Rhodiola kirilowii]